MNPLRRARPVPTIALAFLAAGLFAGCGGEDPEPAVSGTATGSGPGSSGNMVTIAESRFGPERLVVSAGTEVTFENLDPFAHTVTSTDDADAQFDSGDLGESETFERTFDEAGTFAYFCEIHPTMRAEVVVTPPGDDTATAAPAR